jgi:cytokinin riboside 5'-monophosphate phosphoribohydrolase
MSQALCVYCSSSDAVAPIYFETAEEVGARLARQGYTLIYGGGRIGLMGALARAVHQNGGRVIGIIPEFLRSKGLAYEAADELVITRDLRERKATMEARADGFVTLPGGFGTLEEALEIITLKQLGQHAKPIVIVNTQDFYTPLLQLMERIYQERFAKPEYRQLYHFASDVGEVFSYLATYQPASISVTKWF